MLRVLWVGMASYRNLFCHLLTSQSARDVPDARDAPSALDGQRAMPQFLLPCARDARDAQGARDAPSALGGQHAMQQSLRMFSVLLCRVRCRVQST